jgi:hypothetical protein
MHSPDRRGSEAPDGSSRKRTLSTALDGRAVVQPELKSQRQSFNSSTRSRESGPARPSNSYNVDTDGVIDLTGYVSTGISCC